MLEYSCWFECDDSSIVSLEDITILTTTSTGSKNANPTSVARKEPPKGCL